MKVLFLLIISFSIFIACADEQNDPELEMVFEYTTTAQKDTVFKLFPEIEEVDMASFSTFPVNFTTANFRTTVLTDIEDIESRLFIFIISKDYYNKSHVINYYKENSGWSSSNPKDRVIGTLLPLFIDDEEMTGGNISVDLEIKTDNVTDTLSFMSQTNSLILSPDYRFDYEDLLPDTSIAHNNLHLTFKSRSNEPIFIMQYNFNPFVSKSALALSIRNTMYTNWSLQYIAELPISFSLLKFKE